MKQVLVINSSARKQNSRSRKLTEFFVDYWKTVHVDPIIHFRELGNTEVPHIDDKWIKAAFKPASARTMMEAEALKLSDTYIAELRMAEVIVIGAPMYNWSIPSTLKAYIDQILRVNETWKPDPTHIQHPYIGMLGGKKLFLLLSRGEQGYEKGDYNEHMNFQSTYLKTVFNIMGVSEIYVLAVSRQSFDADKIKCSIEEILSHHDGKIVNE